jgi:transposase
MSDEQQSLFSEVALLHEQNASLKAQIEKSAEREARFAAEAEWLKEQLLSLQRQKFGRKSERWESEEQGLLLFNEAELCAKNAENAGKDEEDEVIEVKGFKRRRGKRKPLPDHLPRRIKTIELPESERFAPDGTPLKVIGKEVSEKLMYEPARMEVIQYHRLRYGIDAGEPVKTAPPEPSIIPKGIATPSLLSGIITHKFADGLPLYRQEEMFGRSGVELSRGSMGRWIVKAAESCMPIWNILEERLMGRDYVSCDETHTQVLKEKGRAASSQSWMWVRATPFGKEKIVLFDYDPHRSGAVAKRLLSEMKGYLQVDGYDSYNGIEKQQGIVRIGCNMHGRRGFEKAFKEGSKSGKGLSEQGLRYYQRLYDLEEKCKVEAMTPSERNEHRKEKATPIWDEMKTWAEAGVEKVPPKSRIGMAFTYFLNEYEYLRGYLQDGRLEMDNGFVERAIRKFGIGRNNWMFSDTVEGAQASALFYSLVVTAKINEVNPYAALREIFERVPASRTIEDYERLADLLLSPTSN